jgi:hypothetical protein
MIYFDSKSAPSALSSCHSPRLVHRPPCLTKGPIGQVDLTDLHLRCLAICASRSLALRTYVDGYFDTTVPTRALFSGVVRYGFDKGAVESNQLTHCHM